MSELLALGASHKTAGVAVRERIALTDAAAERFMRELVGEEEIQEAVVLSTCNRTELYLVVGDAVEAETAVLGRLARRAGVRPTELLEGIYSLRNCDAARHLYRVTSGLESMVVGEAEVQGQVKRAYEAALATQSTGPLTNKLFRAALATGKRVRTDTAISVGRASVASVAVDAAREALGDLGSRHVLIIGAGETAEGTARALHEQGVRTMFVANRRRERAIELAQRFGGETVAFDALPARARAGRHRRRLHLLAAPDPRRGGAGDGDARARRPAAAADRPRGAPRHRPGVRGAARRHALRHRRPAALRWRASSSCAGPRRARPRASSRRRSRPSPVGSARSR